MKKFIDSLNESQKKELVFVIQYEAVNAWFLSALFGSNFGSTISMRRACRKYRNVIRFQKQTGLTF